MNRDLKDPRQRPGRRGVILVDDFDAGKVDEGGYVELFDSRFSYLAYGGVTCARDAVKVMESTFPPDDDRTYTASGETAWLRPTDDAQDEWPYCEWELCDERDMNGLKFWIVKLEDPETDDD